MSNKVNIKEIFIKLLHEIDSRETMTWSEIQDFLHEARGTKRKEIRVVRYNGYPLSRRNVSEVKKIIYPKRCNDVTLSFLKKEKRGVYAIHPEKLSYWKCNSIDDIKNPFPYSTKSSWGREKEREDLNVGNALRRMTGGTGIEEFI